MALISGRACVPMKRFTICELFLKAFQNRGLYTIKSISSVRVCMMKSSELIDRLLSQCWTTATKRSTRCGFASKTDSWSMVCKFLLMTNDKFWTSYLLWLNPNGNTVSRSAFRLYSPSCFWLAKESELMAILLRMLCYKLWSICTSSGMLCPPWIPTLFYPGGAYGSNWWACEGSETLSGCAYTIWPLWMKSPMLDPLLKLKPLASSSLATTYGYSLGNRSKNSRSMALLRAWIFSPPSMTSIIFLYSSFPPYVFLKVTIILTFYELPPPYCIWLEPATPYPPSALSIEFPTLWV